MFEVKRPNRNASSVRRMASLVLALVILAASLPAVASAQRDVQPMWVDRISASHEPGRELADPLTMTVDIHVTSRDGAIPGADVSILIVGPAGEQINARATAGRDGSARLSAQIPGGGPYEVILMSLYHGAYFYDSNLDTHTFPGYFVLPVGIVYILIDEANGHDTWIQNYTSEGVFVREWQQTVTLPNPPSPYFSSDTIATDSAGYVYAELYGYDSTGDVAVCEIHKFTSYGTLVKTLGGLCTDGSGQFESIGDFAVDSQNNLHVLDVNQVGDSYPGPTSVEVFNSDGNHLSTWVVPPGANFRSLAFDQQDNLYLGEPFLHEIHKVSKAGAQLLHWPIDFPRSMAVASSNLLYVSHRSEYNHSNVRVFTGTGQLVMEWQPGAMEFPLELDVDANDRIYLASPNQPTPTVAKYTATGGLLLSWVAVGTPPASSEIMDIAVHH